MFATADPSGPRMAAAYELPACDRSSSLAIGETPSTPNVFVT
jgi:hypothetical protein